MREMRRTLNDAKRRAGGRGRRSRIFRERSSLSGACRIIGPHRQPEFRKRERRLMLFPRSQAPAWERTLSAKLRFVKARVQSVPPGPPSKQSFADTCVPKQELRHEGNAILPRRNPSLPWSNPSLPGRNAILLGGNPSLLGRNASLPRRNPSLLGRNASLPGGNPSLPGKNPSLPRGNPSVPGGNPSRLGTNSSLPGGDPSLPGGTQVFLGGMQVSRGRIEVCPAIVSRRDSFRE